MKEIHATVKDSDVKIVYLEHEQSMSSMMMTAAMALNVVVIYMVPNLWPFILGLACWQVYAYFLGKIIGEMKTRCSFQRGVIEFMTVGMEELIKKQDVTPDGTNDDETCLSETGHEKD